MTDDELFAILKSVDSLAMRLPPGMKNFARAVLAKAAVVGNERRHVICICPDCMASARGYPVGGNLVGRLNDLRDDVAEIQREALEAIARIRDMLQGDDGQAWKEAQKFLDRIDAKYKR